MTIDAKRILLVKMSSIGDVVQSLPVAAALRRRFPESYIGWIVGCAAADAVTANPHLSEVLIVGGSGENSSGIRNLPPLEAPWQLRRALRAVAADVTLDLQGLFKSAFVAYLSGASERIGFRTLHEGTFLLNNRPIVQNRRDIHAVDSYLDFAEVMGAERKPVEFTIAISDNDREVVDGFFHGSSNHAALIPGARWESKLWPAERFAAVADALFEEYGCTSVIVGATGDRELAQRIEAAARASTIDLTGRTTLKEIAVVFQRCRVTIGNDTGPLYISAAMDTPTVALFGPSDARRLGPYGAGHAKVVADVNCAPCRNRRCHPLRCMESIEPQRVMAAVRSVLNSNGEDE